MRGVHIGTSGWSYRSWRGPFFPEDVRIKDLAAKYYINFYYLSHLFREVTGYSPKQYLLLNRLSYAKDLLINTPLSVSEIAYQAGFPDDNGFIRSFKHEFGVTPKKYRGTLVGKTDQ